MILQTTPVLQRDVQFDDILNNATRFVFGLKAINKVAKLNDIFQNNFPEAMAHEMVDKFQKHELCIGIDLSRVESHEILDFLVRFALLFTEDVN